MTKLDTDVLVVGAGPAGLVAAALLARSGVNAITVTKYGGTADSPRAHITNQRTMEVMRDLGIEDAVARLAMPQELMGKQIFATSFAGLELSRTMAWGAGPRRSDYEDASPSRMCNISQHALEPVVLNRAKQLGADIRFNHELVGLRQDDDRAYAVVRDRTSGEEVDIRARYVIGADGGRSTVASVADFEFDGQFAVGEAISVWLDVDLTRFTQHRPGAIAFICPQASDIWMSIWPCVQPWTEWNPFFFRHGWAPGSGDEASLSQYVREAIGDPDVPFTIKKIARWQVNQVVARHYKKGRVFLAGDAAHRHSPANGLGSNTSIQDSYNLAWKLALVLKGLAGEALLDSYDQERQPVGRQVVDRAMKSHGEIGPWSDAAGLRPDMSEDDASRNLEELFGATPLGRARRERLHAGLRLMDYQFNAHGVEMGLRYRSSAVASTEPFPGATRDPELFHQASTVPGCHLPHAWLQGAEAPSSTLDTADYEAFTLITGTGGEAWRDAALAVENKLGVRVKVVPLGLNQPHSDVLFAWADVREIGEAGAILVRPDRIIAWRCEEVPSDPQAALDEVMTAVLAT